MKKLTGSLCLTLVVTVLWGAEAPKDVFVEAGGETFVISATRPIQRCVRNRRAQVLSINIRVAGETGVAALEPDWRGGALIEVVENTDERCVVHTEHPLRICELKADAEPKPFNAAKFTIDYVFRKDLAGVIAVERLIAVKPFNFISWNVPLSQTMVKYAVDKVDLVTYPTKAEFRATQGGYSTKSGAYVLGQEPYGDLWFMGREFTTFCPAGEGKGSFYASCDTHAAGGHGKSVVPGEVITVCVCVGIVKNAGDIDRYCAFRKFAEPSSRVRFETLNSALAEKGEKPPLAVTTVDGKAPFGIMWRTGKTAAGEKMAFVTNLSKQPVTVKIAKPSFFGKWTELLCGRDVSGEVRLEPLDLLMLKN